MNLQFKSANSIEEKYFKHTCIETNLYRNILERDIDIKIRITFQLTNGNFIAFVSLCPQYENEPWQCTWGIILISPNVYKLF